MNNPSAKDSALPIRVPVETTVSLQRIYYEPHNMLLNGALMRSVLREMRLNNRNK
jgi:hypothetical protein